MYSTGGGVKIEIKKIYMNTKRSRRYAEIRVTQTISKLLALGIIFS